MKKVFIISSILLSVVLIFLGIYNFAFNDAKDDRVRTNSKRETVERATKTSSEKKTSAVARDVQEKSDDDVARQEKVVQRNKKDDRIIPVTKRRVISPTIDKDKGVIRFYDRDTGKVFEVPLIGGTEKVFSDKSLPGLVYVAWAPDKKRVLTKFADKNGVRIYFFDHRTHRGKQLKRGIDRVDWTTAGDQILYTFFDEKTRRTTLNVSKYDGSEWRILAENVAKGTRFTSIPQSSRVAFWRPPNPYELTELNIVSLLDTDPVVKTIFRGHYNADFLFSPDGERILVSSTQNRGSNARMIGVMNINGGEYKNLHVPTNVRKCVWSSNSHIVYCAFPTGDRDTFWKIDVATNKKSRILNLDDVINSGTRYQAFDLFLAPDESALFFTNVLDGRLYRIEL